MFDFIRSLAARRSTAVPASTGKTYINTIGTEFILIPAGSFTMGADTSFEDAPHRVTLSQSFYLGKYEVTQAEWEAVMGSNPSQFKGRRNPTVVNSGAKRR
jgi:formylglycine-generating enzyme required for sulfatase activity